ncbi:MAG TPA: alpha-amylase family glycosyl hydrolase [Verrucomicrobiae bacterium]
MKSPFSILLRRSLRIAVMFCFLTAGVSFVRADAMLELFQQTWPQITAKMPEIAEAGYDSLWVPNPAKGNAGGYSIGYDVYDPFDLGSQNQQGTIATLYGTQAQLIQMVQTAHRFGIRVYFDNVMNHRAGTVPGYPGSSTPTTYYPGLVPGDFHLQVVSGGYQSWANVSDWCTITDVENNPLLGLCDLAQEPGTNNINFGTSYLQVTPKPVFVRFPTRPDLYMDTNGPLLGAATGTGWPSPSTGCAPVNGWRPFDGHGQPVAEDVSTYLCRAVAWTLYTTGCDGFRLDAVKHVPVNFFGNDTGQTDDPSFAGYTGAIQAMYDYVHGYGNNVSGNGYVETDGNRNSLFNTEAPRNDAMIFGEYEAAALPSTEDYWEYLNSGMRLLNFPMFNEFNTIVNNAGSAPGLSGFDGRDAMPTTSEQGNCDGNGNYSIAQAVNMVWDQDGQSYGLSTADLGLEDAYYFMHEGMPMVYSDGFNHNTGSGTPVVSTENYLGEFGDNSMPDTMYLHNQYSRGGTWSRWSDQNIVAFERYDSRDGAGTAPNAQDVALFAMNDKTSFPGDITFDDGVTRTADGYYLNTTNSTSTAVSNTRGTGLRVGFAPGTILVQMASSSPTGGRAYKKLLVHGATTSMATAQSTENDPNPVNRLIYVNAAVPTGGGAIELIIPSDSWVVYAAQGPQASWSNPSTNAIIFRQGGAEVPHITIYRTDGPNGDTNYNPIFPFKYRGSVDTFGNVIAGSNFSNRTYAIDIPVVTNGAFDILVRSDASCSNTLVKMDGGIDLNSQMGLGPTSATGLAPTNFLDLRDNPPGYADDVFLGYEQAALLFRNGPEKFAARNIASNNVVSLGAETYYYTVGSSTNVVTGSGYGAGLTNQTAQWVYHDPAATNTANLPNNSATQRNPLLPADGQSADVYVKIGFQFQVNTFYLYYTTDGSNPEGDFGFCKGTTQVVQGHFLDHDSAQANIDWWKATIPAQSAGTQVRYKIGVFSGGSAGNSNILPISDSETSGSKYFGLNEAAITNFNPTTAVVWTHNDLNSSNITTGLQGGFHIVRGRVFLTRPGQASVYNTFSQTFYYDAALPQGVIAGPNADGFTISNQNFTITNRSDSTATEVDVNIQDSNPNNDDLATGQANGNGNDASGNPIFVPATPITANTALSAVWTNYPQEFHFSYVNVPITGTATITLRIKEYTSGIYTNRYTTLTRAVNTVAPSQVVEISNPSIDGSIITMSQGTNFPIQACFTGTLDTNNINLFSIYINGVLQPRRTGGIPNYSIGGAACGAGMHMLSYNWSDASIGTNVIQVIYTNGITLSDQKTVIIAPPLVITGMGENNQLLLWNSAPGVNYEVWATTNLALPFEPISGVIPSQGGTTEFLDNDLEQQKFYEIEVVPSD